MSAVDKTGAMPGQHRTNLVWGGLLQLFEHRQRGDRRVHHQVPGGPLAGVSEGVDHPRGTHTALPVDAAVHVSPRRYSTSPSRT